LYQKIDCFKIKPFAFSELLARLRASQHRPPLKFNYILQVGDLTIDMVKREVKRGGRLIQLSGQIYPVYSNEFTVQKVIVLGI
jgi:DNA-binding response OmpR family regulator